MGMLNVLFLFYFEHAFSEEQSLKRLFTTRTKSKVLDA